MTDSDTATFKFNDGRDQDNIWGSGIYMCVIYYYNDCKVATVIYN